MGVLLALTLKPPEDAQLPLFCGVEPVLGKELAMFPIENGVVLFVEGAEDTLGGAFLRGTLVVLEPWPKAELTKSPKRFGFLLMIPMLEEEEGWVVPQLLPKMSPTMEGGPPGKAVV